MSVQDLRFTWEVPANRSSCAVEEKTTVLVSNPAASNFSNAGVGLPNLESRSHPDAQLTCAEGLQVSCVHTDTVL